MKPVRCFARPRVADLLRAMLVQDPSKPMDEQEFKNRADQALEDLYRRLLAASERHDFEADFNGGALVIEFEDASRQVRGEPQCASQPGVGFGADEELQTGLGPRAERFRRPRFRADVGGAGGRRGRPANGRRSESLRWLESTFRTRSARRSAPTATSHRACFRANWKTRYLEVLLSELRSTRVAVDARNRLSRRRHAQPDGARGAGVRFSRRFRARPWREATMEAAPGGLDA